MSGFADLRTNIDTGHTEESFWPSFTDIMMVIVMIFLISSSVLFLRNWQLVKDLSTTAAAEAEAREEAELQMTENIALTTEMLSLEEQVAYLEEALTGSRLQNLRIAQQKGALERQLQTVTENFRDLESKTRALDVQLQLTKDDNANLRESVAETARTLQSAEQALRKSQLAERRREFEIESLQEELDVTQQQLDDSTKQLSDAQAALASSQNALKQQEQQALSLNARLDDALAAKESSSTELTDLQAQFTDLESRYKKLVRPARTSKGKYIVSIRHYRDSRGTHYELREDAVAPSFKTLDEASLDSALAELSQQHGQDLYIRIIFPENSGLDYNQAWKFTQEYLNKYDYYYLDDKIQ